MTAGLAAEGLTNESRTRLEAMGLTPREATIVAGAAAGIPDERLGELLGMSPRHIPRIRKAGLAKLLLALEAALHRTPRAPKHRP